jgi:hypothetical protein
MMILYNLFMNLSRKLEIFIYIWVVLVGIYLTITQIELDLVTAIEYHHPLKVGFNLNLGLIGDLILIGNAVAFLIFAIKRE